MLRGSRAWGTKRPLKDINHLNNFDKIGESLASKEQKDYLDIYEKITVQNKKKQSAVSYFNTVVNGENQHL